ncbi:MAG: hypothetical protein MK108_13455 [Mariniblastus sp.]|nr:hypothetical protein [Mariniblastus sp.]
MYRCFVTAVLGFATLFSTGCMLQPLNLAHAPYRRIEFSGYLTAPNVEVSIQAKDPVSGRWQEIDQTESVDFATHATSGVWYLWMKPSVYVPNRYWTPDPKDDELYRAQVRAVSEDGRQLLSFNQEPNLYGDPQEEWSEHGNRMGSVTIFSRHGDF